MIPKKIKRQSTGASKEKSVANLIDYIHAPTEKNLEEKLLFIGARGFVFEGFERQKQEMLAHAYSNVLSHNPVMHYLFSWKENEQPSKEQFEEVIDIFMEETGLNNHLIMWGVHQNTKNIHMHIAANKIDLDTEKITRINNNLDIEALHKIVAKIEHKQGWESTPNARYICDDEGNISRRKTEKASDTVAQEARIFEISYGEKSAIRIAKETALPVLEKSASWKELHTKLDELGMEYRKKGSGAIIKVDETFIKASSVDRGFSLKQLEKRLGTFEEKTQPPYFTPNTNNFLTTKIIKSENKNDTNTKNRQPRIENLGDLPRNSVFPMSTCPMVSRNKGGNFGTSKGLMHRKRRERNRQRNLESLLPTLRRAVGKVDNFMRRNCARAVAGVNIDLWFQYQQKKFQVYQNKVVHKIQKQLGIVGTAGIVGMVTENKQFPIPKYSDWLKINAPEEFEAWRYNRGEQTTNKDKFEENNKKREENNNTEEANVLSSYANQEFYSIYSDNEDKILNCMTYNAENSLNRAYFRHLAHIQKNIKKGTAFDNSRMDAMIALRMRATGHTQSDIKQAIKDCAIQWRKPNERKSWDDYARRSTEYAFSYAGDKELEKNQEQLATWQKCEQGVNYKRQRTRERFSL